MKYWLREAEEFDNGSERFASRMSTCTERREVPLHVKRYLVSSLLLQYNYCIDGSFKMMTIIIHIMVMAMQIIIIDLIVTVFMLMRRRFKIMNCVPGFQYNVPALAGLRMVAGIARW